MRATQFLSLSEIINGSEMILGTVPNIFYLFVKQFSTVTCLPIVVFNLFCQQLNLLLQLIHFEFVFSNDNLMLLELLLQFSKTLNENVISQSKGGIFLPQFYHQAPLIKNLFLDPLQSGQLEVD